MNIDEAYEACLKELDNLFRAGVRVEVMPKFSDVSPTHGLDYAKWLYITMSSSTREHAELIFAAERSLGERGIRFDTGGNGTERDWWLDNCLRVSVDAP